MSNATHPLKLPNSIKAAAERLAKQDGVSLNNWIAAAVAQKVGAVEAAADFFRRRAGDAKPGDLLPLLASAPDRAPDPGDELTLPPLPQGEDGAGQGSAGASPWNARGGRGEG